MYQYIYITGGCPNFPLWRMNPQYLLEILVKTRVTIVLETDMEYDDNERYTSGEDSNDEEEDDSDNENDGRAIGFYLLRANGNCLSDYPSRWNENISYISICICSF